MRTLRNTEVLVHAVVSQRGWLLKYLVYIETTVLQMVKRRGSGCNCNKIVINIWGDEDIREHQSSCRVSKPGREHSSGGGRK